MIASGRDPHLCRPFERGAVCCERRPVHRGVAGAAVPAGVSAAAVSEAGDVADEDLAGAEGCPLGQRLGASVIHLPRLSTSSPYTFENRPTRRRGRVGGPNK
jgi:hypothetical protein